MRPRFTYLASPIDQVVLAKAGQLREWRACARNALFANNLAWYDPSAAFGGLSGDMPVGREIAKVNRVAMGQCDGLLALLPHNVPTIGTWVEMTTAVQNRGIPVAAVGRQPWGAPFGVEWFEPEDADYPAEAIAAAATWLSRQDAPGKQAPAVRDLPVRLDPGAQLPTRTYPDDAGFDLYVNEDTEIPPGAFVDVPCGARVELPDGVWGMLVGRSSTLRKHGLLVMPGIIDTGYRGELFAGVQNLTDQGVGVGAGSRLAQLILMPNETRYHNPVSVEKLSDSPRGSNGFGSSGN